MKKETWSELDDNSAEHFYIWVERIAIRLLRAKNLPSRYKDDLTSSGLLGLVEARNRYSKSKDVPFKAFAYLRVKGAMIDFLRKQGELSNPKESDDLAIQNQDADTDTLAEAHLLLTKVAKLSPLGKEIIHDIYFKDNSLREISKKYCKSRSWVCRKHAKAITDLRTMIAIHS